MGAAQIKEELYHFIESGDPKLIKMLYAVAKEYSSDDYELSDAYKVELDRRLEKYEADEMNFSSWDTVKDRIRKRAKDVL
ncbi:MAG: addiction module protein [Bacteroidota bacterium]